MVIPLYSDAAGLHDYVVQAKGAFDQTVSGFHQAARNGIRLEVRVVLHKLTIPRLTKLVDYIYRNLAFVEHIALMGLEYTGNTPRNIHELWIDPYDYQDELETAVEYLDTRNKTVSIYNHQLCVLRPSLWKFARKSISDWKMHYLPECQKCSALPLVAESSNGQSRSTVITFTHSRLRELLIVSLLPFDLFRRVFR
jgi:His-Xaa-Ser system radical SAM maturase HxsC